MKSYYSANELFKFELESFPSTIQGVRKKINQENWESREVAGKGGKGGMRREFLVPDYVLDEIKTKQTQKLLSETASEELPALPVVASSQTENLTTRQAMVEGSRKGVIKAVEELMTLTNIQKQTAIKTLLINAQLPENTNLLAMLRNAADTRGGSGTLPAARTIQRWFDKRDRNELAPKIKDIDFSTPAWAPAFLSIWQSPQKPSISSAYREFSEKYNAEIPSIHQVRRFLDKLGNVSKNKGRMLPRELRNIEVFVRRTFDTLLPTDIYTADGHTFDAEIQHPFHGRPFRPEITTVADIATRRLVGWSVDLAESSLAVLAAVSHAVNTGGVPAVFYVDNGSGYKNALMSDVSTGIMGRLGTTMVHSIPYNSQARGVIERLHQTVWINGAKKMPTFIGADMDRQAKQLAFKKTRQDLQKNGSLIGSKLIPSFDEFISFCEDQVEAYNNTPHSSLPKITDADGVKRCMTPNECWNMKLQQGAEIVDVSTEEAQYLFMPQTQRKIQRGEINFLNNRYFNKQLEEFNGEVMTIGFDIHDGSKVWVYDDLGRLVCEAEFNGNAQKYMPDSYIESARDKREEGRIKRKQANIEEAMLERRGTNYIEHQDSVNIAGSEIMMNDLLKAGLKSIERVNAKLNNKPHHDNVIEHEASKVDEFNVPEDMAEKYEQYLISSKKPASELTPKEARWLTTYPKTSQYRVFSKKVANE